MAMLRVMLGGGRFADVETLAEASREVQLARGKMGAGAWHARIGPRGAEVWRGTLDGGGIVVARISYNGRVWSANAGILLSGAGPVLVCEATPVGEVAE